MAEVLNQEQVLVNEDTLTVIADYVRFKLGEETNPLAEGFTRYTPMELANKIANEMPSVKDAIPNSAKRITGNCRYMFAYGTWDWYIKQFSEILYTDYLTNCENMFFETKLETIPLKLNFSPTEGIGRQLFYNATKLKELPEITGRVRNFYNFCYQCHNIREIPEQWAEGIDWNYINTVGNTEEAYFYQLFAYCYSLRKIPKSLMKKIYGIADNSQMIRNCYSLDEIEGFRCGANNTTYDVLSSNFVFCSRLKRVVFDYEDETTNTPRTQNWKYVTIQLKYTGYASSSDKNYILDYNSGITADKEVTDDATYQALKNDPDWFTCKVEYSRYNHDSAVETINSLPDTSAYLAANGGTNTIEFKGVAGSATDGGAINTLTEAEIAVAAAKGWTVSFV